MRILHISSARTFGGGERHFVDLTRELAARGHDVFAALRPTNEWQERLGFIPGERILYVSIRNSFGMFSARQIARFVRENQIEIVHAHLARDYLPASLAARAAAGARMVLTRHVTFPLKPFYRFALRNVDAAIAVSGGVAEQLENIFPVEKVRIIPNGIIMPAAADGAEFRRFHGISPDVPLVTTLGELKPLKGQRDFVLAANEILKRIPDCRFVVAGRDNSFGQSFRRELKRLVKVFGFEDRFLWLDWLDDISPLMGATDIFVSPSHSESFGLAILDAMAAGCPVVATETAGAIELIDDAAALVPIRDPIALAEKVCWYLERPDERAQLGQHLQTVARERFGLERMVDATEQLYEELLR